MFKCWRIKTSNPLSVAMPLLPDTQGLWITIIKQCNRESCSSAILAWIWLISVLACPEGKYNDQKGLNCTGKECYNFIKNYEWDSHYSMFIFYYKILTLSGSIQPLYSFPLGLPSCDRYNAFVMTVDLCIGELVNLFCNAVNTPQSLLI